MPGICCLMTRIHPIKEGVLSMKKNVRSTKVSSPGKSSLPDAVNKPDPVAEDISGTPNRKEIRQDVHRTNVPRQSQRPTERSNQPRSHKP